MKNFLVFTACILIASSTLNDAFAKGHSAYRSGRRHRSYGYGVSQSGFSVGIKAGAHFAYMGMGTSGSSSNFDGTQSSGTVVNASSITPSDLVNVTGGAIFNYSLTEKFSIQSELLYVQKGYRTSVITSSNDGPLEKVSEGILLNYLEIPLMAKTTVGGENFKFFVNAGPTFSYALGGQVLFGKETAAIKFNKDEDGFNRFDFGFAGGLGFGIKAGPGMFFPEGRYGMGMTAVFNSGGEGTPVHIGYNTSLGYLIHF